LWERAVAGTGGTGGAQRRSATPDEFGQVVSDSSDDGEVPPQPLPARPASADSRATAEARETGGQQLARTRLPGARPVLRPGLFLRYGVRPFLFAADMATLALAGELTSGLTGGEVVFVLLALAFFASGGLYRSRLTLSALDDLPTIGGRALVAGATAISLAAVINADGQRLLVTSALAVVLVPAARALCYAVVRRVRARKMIAHPTLILGAGRIGARLAAVLREHPEYGLKPVGFLDSDPLLGDSDRPIPLLGGHDALAQVIVEFGVHDVIVAFGSAPESEMVSVIRTCDRLNCEIFFVPRLFELMAINSDTDHIWGLPVLRLRRAPFRTAMWNVKRLLDIVVSAIALVLLSPLLLVCALATRLETGRGVLFKQLRVGIDGRGFELLKFRSMKPATDLESDTRWNIGDDERVGRVGRFLRRSSLDELPQLWNILRGDMTLVGPRPERPHFVAQFTESHPRYTARHRVPAGLTGWAQVHGLRGDTSIEDRARFDNFYIENWSLWLDVKIIFWTVAQIVRGTGR
jgi:exopolysaccharide biosynthesis polyprenyl glycosylphosphotransferase